MNASYIGSFVVSFLQLLFDLLNHFTAGFIFEPDHLTALEVLGLEEIWNERNELDHLLLDDCSDKELALVRSAVHEVLNKIWHRNHLLHLTGEDLAKFLLERCHLLECDLVWILVGLYLSLCGLLEHLLLLDESQGFSADAVLSRHLFHLVGDFFLLLFFGMADSQCLLDKGRRLPHL